VLNVLLCAPVFGACWAWSVKRGVEVLWVLGAIGGGGKDGVKKDKEREKEKVGEERVAAAVDGGGVAKDSVAKDGLARRRVVSMAGVPVGLYRDL
jgi:hypothetical protein